MEENTARNPEFDDRSELAAMDNCKCKANFLLACREQTLFSAFVSPAEKRALFSAGEIKAEKSVCSPQASDLPELIEAMNLPERFCYSQTQK